jgi:uncharacterized protein
MYPDIQPALVPSVGPATSFRALVRRHRVVAYVALAWAFSWVYWLSMFARGDVVTPGGEVSQHPGLFGPMAAAILVTAVALGRSGVMDLVNRMFRWRVALRWYALAALPFGLFLLGIGVLAATGGTVPTLDDLATYSGLPKLGLAAVALAAFGGAMGEEVGWRGFAQPELERRMSFLRASLTVALVWAIWHVPLLPVIESYRQLGLAVVPMLVLGLGSGAIILGWLYDRSGGSILVAALFHFGLNMGSATLAGRGLPAALATTGVMIWAVLIVIAELRRSRRLVASRVPHSTHARRPRGATLRDASMRMLLRSPLRTFVGAGMLLVTYRGRRSGHTYTTPVEYVRDADRLLVLVARPSRKQWWRNVQENPLVEVTLDGRTRRANAVVEVGADAQVDLARYAALRPRMARRIDPADGPVVVTMAVH